MRFPRIPRWLAGAVLAGLVSFPALAQDRGSTRRTEAPPGQEDEDPIAAGSTGRTAGPSKPGDTGRTPVGPLHEEAPAERADKPGLVDWPWHGTERSPEWTQDRSYFPKTRFWLLDPGRVELDAVYDVRVNRHKQNELYHLIQAEAHVGLVPHLSLGVTENVFVPPGGGFHQEGNRIEIRFSPFTYGQFPLNPTAMFTWHPRQGEPGEVEGRLLIGGELFERFTIVGNGFYQQETGGEKNAQWGFTAAAAFELVKGVLRVGGEMRLAWLFKLGEERPFRTYELEAGPSFYFRPFGLIDEKWGRHLKLQGTCFFGANDRAPAVEGVGVVGYEF